MSCITNTAVSSLAACKKLAFVGADVGDRVDQPPYNNRMGEHIEIHPRNPQPRIVTQVVEALRRGALIAYPTDSCYALGCALANAQAAKRIRRLRGAERYHNFTLVCRDLSEIATYAKVSNAAYRLVRSLTPGPYTFVLPATREVPRKMLNPKRKTIGIRVPDHPVPSAILTVLGEPIMSSTLQLAGDEHPLNDGLEIMERIGHDLDIVLDAGPCGLEPSSVVDLTGELPQIIRRGKGNLDFLGID
jgi:tRNA threonylcarbamoyl adenosine modification protein (Sua5/YciO/YrdC/YwlC family)